jgi:hypothetical protein
MKCKYVVLLAVLAFTGLQAQAEAAIVLGSAGSFGLLGGSGVSNTGSSVINGSVGSSPTATVSGFPSPGTVNSPGILYLAADPATAQAHLDLIAAYTAALNTTGGTPGPADLGGASLNPGVYTYASTAPWTAGTLTLNALGDPNAQWIFQIGSGLTTPAGASVALINGASSEHVFWQIGSSATLGATNNFAGNILAQTSITLGGGTLNGRALAIGGLVSITTAETVNVPEPGAFLLLVSGLASLFALRILKRKNRS